MDKHSYLSNADPAALESIYQQYLKDPAAVDPGWARFFEGFELARTHHEVLPAATPAAGAGSEQLAKEFKVIDLINGYRERGHLFTRTNPVRERRKYAPPLSLATFGLGEADLDTVFAAGGEVGLGPARLRDIIDLLEQTYCQSIGAEFRFIRDPEKVKWLQERMEGTRNKPALTIEQKKAILAKLNEAVVFEKYLGKKFIGAKRFSIEGAEALIPALDMVIEHGAALGITEYVIGMAHRGRLNVLANTLRKSYDRIFSEFDGKDYADELVEGDVKYHMGYSSVRRTNSGREVRLTLAPNPSHLESVGPVMQGISRAIIERDDRFRKGATAPILIHGDAAVAGQGVVYETVQMAGLKAYEVGGTIHIILNNQVGFTTNYIDARTSTYCTDVAKVTQCPVFHVNGDDAEAVALTMELAMDHRQRYGTDVWVDILCYRKHGHNEGDEPKFTQPLLYKAIAAHPDPREIYTRKLIDSGVEGAAELAAEMERSFTAMLDERLLEARRQDVGQITNFMAERWKGYRRATTADLLAAPATGVDKATLQRIGEKLTVLHPDGKKFFSKLEKILNDRRKMMADGVLDWGMAELLAYGSLLVEGHPVRFTGQDVERGTFSHRHAVVKVEDSEEEFIHLKHIQEGQALLQIHNSLLSEYAVLGFEYGYALTNPDTLTIWEAQFGDFVNGAQIILDQYLCCAEEKWDTQNGIVLLLPHGYEGQGAEHSSARIERFLQSCADGNMVVVNCTTPANFFHVLRRQMAWDFRKPLVVFTPKSLLRHPKCVSTLDELAGGRFQPFIDDATADPKQVRTVILTQGKVHYDLREHREEKGIHEVALLRVEQLHPLPVDDIKAALGRYARAERFVWVQEEPLNMGAWTHIRTHLQPALEVELECIGRPASGAPATGSSKRSAKQQQEIIARAFAQGPAAPRTPASRTPGKAARARAKA
ncbi:MAG: 2-oxoglutarate dehydrogenase E1 component [Flavobacteriales bacterium]|nr:2-oxoglutarate dehydrogenase E1 component [Flavobacteriales bacterium]MCC6576732.1 2-oxoglutarate dehydrogenase E1 component [Flavobacteriales bacterium]NUQ15628.1 2-oxoglutarate dehydrogenase E1 component [Flavobacteriales bacterium]